MIRLLLFIAIIGTVFGVRYWLRTLPPERKRHLLRTAALWGGGGLLLLATLSGHLNPLFAALAVVLVRLEQVLNLTMLFQQLFQRFKPEKAERAANAPPVHSGQMTDQDARAILGVPTDADADTIRAAYQRLMQRLHPDRGGSDYLAAQLNAAKRHLLGD